MAWALESGSITLGLRLATAVGGWLWGNDDPREGLRYLERLLEKPGLDGVPLDILADALREYGAQADLAGEDRKATALYERSLALYDELADDRGRAVLLHRLANQAMWQGQFGRARDLVQKSQAIHEKRRDQWGIAQTLGTLGAIARDSGEEEAACELLAQSAAISRDLGDAGVVAWWTGGMLAELSALSLKAGRISEAEARAREALLLAENLHDRPGRVFAMGVLACVSAERGELEHAGRLWAAIENEDTGAPLGGWRRHRQTFEARIREIVGPEFERGRAEGWSLTLDDAVAFALAAQDVRAGP